MSSVTDVATSAGLGKVPRYVTEKVKLPGGSASVGAIVTTPLFATEIQESQEGEQLKTWSAYPQESEKEFARVLGTLTLVLSTAF